MRFLCIQRHMTLKYFLCLILSCVFSFQFCQVAFGMGGMETRLIYYPIKSNMMPVRLEIEGKLQDIYFYSLDGLKLNAWYIKAKDNMPTVIYCHGQGENISLWQNVAQFLADNGYGVFMLDYRGHGRSEGTPFESGLYIDLESSIKYLKDNEKVEQSNIVLWGRSIGGAVVADVASRDRFRGVILESTFTNIRDEAIHLTQNGILESRFGFWEGLASNFVKFMPLTQKFQTEFKIYKINYPLLIGHSIHDKTVPVQMAYKLAAHNPKCQLYISKTGAHHSSEWFYPRVLEFLETLNYQSIVVN